MATMAFLDTIETKAKSSLNCESLCHKSFYAYVDHYKFK